MADAFPAVTTVRVREALDAVGDIVTNLALAIRGASVLTLLVAVLVLGGALAAGHRHRVYDAVILKTVGATRMRLLSAYALEYLALGLATALFGVAAGSAAAALVITKVMNLPFAWLPGPACSPRPPARSPQRCCSGWSAPSPRSARSRRPCSATCSSAEAVSGLRASDNTPRPAANVAAAVRLLECNLPGLMPAGTLNINKSRRWHLAPEPVPH